VCRTVVFKLDVDDSNATLLHGTVEEYLLACNYVIQHAWQDGYEPTSKRNSTTGRTPMRATRHDYKPTSFNPHATGPPKLSKASSPGGK
jgi:hypothetical protein